MAQDTFRNKANGACPGTERMREKFSEWLPFCLSCECAAPGHV